jgi:hypothetical protein
VLSDAPFHARAIDVALVEVVLKLAMAVQASLPPLPPPPPELPSGVADIIVPPESPEPVPPGCRPLVPELDDPQPRATAAHATRNHRALRIAAANPPEPARSNDRTLIGLSSSL